MRSHIVIIGAGISGLSAAITIGEGVDPLIATGELDARPEMTILDAADWIGGRARTDVVSQSTRGRTGFTAAQKIRSTSGPATGATSSGRSASTPPRGASTCPPTAPSSQSSANGR